MSIHSDIEKQNSRALRKKATKRKPFTGVGSRKLVSRNNEIKADRSQEYKYKYKFIPKF
jgi:hypothetical protein